MGKYSVTFSSDTPSNKETVREVKEVQETKDDDSKEEEPLVGAGMRSGGRRRFSRKRRYSRKGMGMRRRISRKRRRGYGLSSGGRYRVRGHRRGGSYVRSHVRRRRR